MSVKQIGLSGLCWLLCGLGWLHAQEGPITAPGSKDIPPLFEPFNSGSTNTAAPFNAAVPETSTSGPLGSAFQRAPAGVTPEGIAIDEGSPPPPPPVPIPLGRPISPYLNYPRSPCCCGPIGGCGPIGSEVFIYSGFAFPVGEGIFNRFLHTGWDIEGGGRLYLFNPPSTAAWMGQLSVGNIFARTGNANQPVTLTNVRVRVPSTTPNATAFEVIPQLPLTVSSLNLTFVTLGFGREWWLCGSAYPGQQHGCNWRAGIDGGGRWGSGEVQFNEIQHHTGVVGGMYAAIHSDVEWPFRCGIPFAGIRLEYQYIWTPLLQDQSFQNNGNFQSLNLLFQLGVRF